MPVTEFDRLLVDFISDDENRIKSKTDAELACDITHQLNPAMLGKKYGFKNYEYMIQIFNDLSQQIVVTKRSQIGATDGLARREAVFCLQHKGVKVIYTFPTADDLKVYVKDRFDDLIRQSPRLSEELRGNPDGVMLKKFGASAILFRGRSTERSAISIPATRVTHDESDFSEQEIMETFRSRLSAARIKLNKNQYDAYKRFEEYANIRAREVNKNVHWFKLVDAEEIDGYFIIPHGLEIRFSTPTIPGYGVSRLYYGDDESLASDMMELWIRHPKCGFWQIPVWGPQSIEGFYEFGEKEPQGRKFYKCMGCNQEMSFNEVGLWDKREPIKYEHIAWVPKNKMNDWRGYHLPWYAAAFQSSAETLLREYHKIKIKSRRDNFFLGLPSKESNMALTLDIMNKLNNEGFTWETIADGFHEYIFGADQGAYVVIGKVIPNTQSEVNPLGKIAIVYCGHFGNMEAFPSISEGILKDNGQLSRLLNMFGVSVGAIDNLPNETASKQLQDLHQGRLWRITSSGSLGIDIKPNVDTMSATESRVKALDKVIKFIMDGYLLLPAVDSEESQVLKKHCCNMIKVMRDKKDSKGRDTGLTETVYVKTGPEHYLHAIKFMLEAMELSYLTISSIRRVAEPYIDSIAIKQ